MTLITLSRTENGEIYESANFGDGLYFLEAPEYKGKRKLALLDLDNTVVSYRHTFGTDQWFDFDFGVLTKNGASPQEAKDKLLPSYLDVVRRLHPDDVYAVEEETPAKIRYLQSIGIDTLILTSRGSFLLDETLKHLARFELDFNQGSFKGKEKKLPQNVEEGLFTKGLILTGGKHKGECLFSCLEDEKEMPEVIVMWDDKLGNLEKVRASIEAYNAKKKIEAEQSGKTFVPIKFIGIRYSKLDHIINNVNPKVVELQRKYFARVLSDEHALAIAKAESKKKRKQCVDIDYQPSMDSVTVSVTKGELYHLLKDLEPTLDKYRILGTEKQINGKLKLPWQFQFSVSQFEPLFHKLSQHGLIEPGQYDVLSLVFTKMSSLVGSMYQMSLQRQSGMSSTASAPDVVPPNDLMPLQHKKTSAAAQLVRK